MQQPPTSSPPGSTSSTSRVFDLVLMRHAKSDWSGDNMSDHDRPLNDRGMRDAPRMARWLAESGFLPDHILCSSATRTQQTAALMQSYWNNTTRQTANLHVIPDLYLAPFEVIFGIIHDDFASMVQSEKGSDPLNSSRFVNGLPVATEGQTPFRIPQTVLVLAHNPGISHAASVLLGHSVGLSTAAVVALRCDVPNWSTTLTADNTQCVAEMKPKSLGHGDRSVL